MCVVLERALTICHGTALVSPAIFATEGDPFSTFNPYIHTADDRMDLKDGEFSFEHALEFVKVAVGFAVELGGWVE
ncbi:hypothetical protein PAXINDRAFT_90708 [Paxillus involutus ATCC 200175]|uniref:Peptide hydrolase n=1 Tax=Paxillus involutus ATCC 200175 TaxID=664439 RepID=A0A0C9SN41_PAXIN|nr:hypothetical protein PAXINDRAFT_90708 [Paxillus involutus ATCC 200175]